ncbi:conserved hypothetical protein [Arthrobacter sp. 8AJ]|nr:conserved hypothetical protein [Arthrobacter sp. 8AJ]
MMCKSEHSKSRSTNLSGRTSRAKRKTQSGNSRISDHKQKGKVLVPPILARGDITQLPWLRDTFPDMIWICALISSLGAKRGMQLVANVVDPLHDVTETESLEGEGASPSPVFTGTLTSFDRLSPKFRPSFLEELDRAGLYERAFPTELRKALLSYEDLPARWLFEHPAYPIDPTEEDTCENTLRPVVFDSIHGQSDVTTKAKTMIVRAYLYAGKLQLTPSIAQDWFPILERYPDGVTEEERSRIEPSMRSTFLTLSQMGNEENERSIDWARSFWRQNWCKFDCVREETTKRLQQGGEGEGVVLAAHKHWVDQLNELYADAISISQDADPDLYDPDKHEVLTGLVFRQIEFVRAMIDSPALWHIDSAAGTTRGLIETRIVFKWMIRQDRDIFSRFKDYGRGKLKLYKLHAEELRDSLDEPSEALNAQIDRLQELVNGDVWEEFQHISIAGNFASVDTRRMADQVGLLEDYRLIFSPASAAVHGEWGPISQHTLTRCLNPLHRGHRIPQAPGGREMDAFNVNFALKLLTNLVDDYRTALSVA